MKDLDLNWRIILKQALNKQDMKWDLHSFRSGRDQWQVTVKRAIKREHHKKLLPDEAKTCVVQRTPLHGVLHLPRHCPPYSTVTTWNYEYRNFRFPVRRRLGLCPSLMLRGVRLYLATDVLGENTSILTSILKQSKNNRRFRITSVLS